MAGTMWQADTKTRSLKRMSSHRASVRAVSFVMRGTKIFRHSSPAAIDRMMATNTSNTWRRMGTLLPVSPVRLIISSTQIFISSIFSWGMLFCRYNVTLVIFVTFVITVINVIFVINVLSKRRKSIITARTSLRRRGLGSRGP